MGDLLSNGVSGLLAFQRALDTTAHNIANVGTPGYSRQRVDMSAREPSRLGDNFIGNGVTVSGINRIYDQLIAQQARSSNSSFQRFDAFAAQTERVNNLFANTTTGLSATLQKFADALQNVSSNPTSTASRQVLLSQANSVAQRLKSYDAQLGQYDTEVQSRIAGQATDISTIAQQIAQLNLKIFEATGRGGQPNDLLDQRDKLLSDLSEHVDVTSVSQDDGRINVFIGSGQPLVVGDKAADVVTIPDPYDPSRSGIGIRVSSGPVVDISNNLTGGTLGGLLEFRKDVLDPTRNAIGRISIGLTEVINGKHREGVDLLGDLGGDFFAVGAPEGLRNAANPSTATVSVTRTDVSALSESDYILQRAGGVWQLNRVDNGAAVTLTGTGTALDPFVADGIAIELNGTAQDGDRFLIRPTRGAVDDMRVLITDPGRIAAAAPIRTAAGASNSGTATISAGEVTDVTDAQLQSTVTITFPTATTYSIDGGPAVAYTSGSAITANGWSVEISGTPAAGDSFTVSSNAGGSGDNRNAQALIASFKDPVFDGGTVSIDGSTTQLVGRVGVTTSQAQANRDAQEVIQQDAAAAQDSVSGVNLDEEAANMLKYQQAYQAAAQIIRVSSTLFDTLLAAAGR
jgi:flagellar hook-associated protein 1 FlgK